VGCEKRELIEPTPDIDISKRLQMRVLLLKEARGCKVAANGGFSAVDATTWFRSNFGRNGDPVEVSLSAGGIVIGGKLFGREMIIEPGSPYVVSVNGERYRGGLRLTVREDGQSFDVINVVPIESYLAGVVGAEMPGYWEPEALKAQAIASRTYGLFIKRAFGGKRNWDVRRTQASQVYKGISAESATVWAAVNETTGKVLVTRHNDGQEGIFPTYYSSTCGGHTQDSKSVFGDSYGTLGGVKCPYCRGVAKMSFFFWPMAEFDADQVSEQIIKRYPKVQDLGKITNIEPSKVSEYDKYGRITSVKLVGKEGKSAFLRGEDLRLTIDPSGTKIRSMACRILKSQDKFRFYSGRGYGHGVGMCQCGAQGMARSGRSSEEILGYYYPGSKIMGY
jgi:stage II sporulation protein D